MNVTWLWIISLALLLVTQAIGAAYLRRVLIRRGAKPWLIAAVWLWPILSSAVGLAAGLGGLSPLLVVAGPITLGLSLLWPDKLIASTGGPIAVVKLAQLVSRVRKETWELGGGESPPTDEPVRLARIQRLLGELEAFPVGEFSAYVTTYVTVVRAWLGGVSIDQLQDDIARIDQLQLEVERALRTHQVETRFVN